MTTHLPARVETFTCQGCERTYTSHAAARHCEDAHDADID